MPRSSLPRVDGRPTHSAELATTRGARLIVVGTTSERPLAGIVLGSVPYRLLHRSSVPVLVVPQETA